MTTTQHFPSLRRARRRYTPACVLALGLLASAFASAEQPSRFSGGGSLSVVGVQASADQRFGLNAELQAATVPEKASSDGRFALHAELAANKALATACGPQVDLMFQNSFE